MAENMNENGGLNTGMDLSSYMVAAKANKEETAAKETPAPARSLSGAKRGYPSISPVCPPRSPRLSDPV